MKPRLFLLFMLILSPQCQDFINRVEGLPESINFEQLNYLIQVAWGYLVIDQVVYFEDGGSIDYYNILKIIQV